MLYDRTQPGAKPINLTENFDRNVESVSWSADSKTIYFETEEKARIADLLHRRNAGCHAQSRFCLTRSTTIWTSAATAASLVFTRTTLSMPAEIFAANSDGSDVRQLTHQNDALLSQLDLPKTEPFWFEGAGGTQVEGLLLRPPHFDATKKYPMLLLIHGGPQGEWDDSWGYRWNEQMMAAPGYVVVVDQSSRLIRLRPKIHRRNQPRLGRQGLRRPDERRRRSHREISVHR